MILAFIYYCFVFTICTLLGFSFYKLLKLTTENIFEYSLTGIGLASYLGVLFSLFGPVNFSALAATIGSSVIIVFLKPAQSLQHLKHLFLSVKNLPKHIGYFLVITSIAIIYQSAQASKIHDDGMYYQQTILWAQQFGIVKGLANLHPALGLFSSWHLFTALFDPQLIGLNPFHHFNGLLLIVFILFIATNRQLGSTQTNLASLFTLMLLPLLGFMFLTAANADLPLIIFTLYLLYQTNKKGNLVHIFFLAAVTFSIKPPALLALIIVFIYGLNQIKHNASKLIFSIALTVLISSPFFIKNFMLSGYLFYPSQLLNIFNSEWKVPEAVNNFYQTGIVSWGINDSFDVAAIYKTGSLPIAERFLLWFNRAGYKGFANKFILAGFITSILLLIRYRKKLATEQVVLIIAALFVLVAEWILLSQYRLLLPTIIGLTWLILNNVNINTRFWLEPKLLSISVIILVAITFVPFSLFKSNSRNKSITSFNGFNTRYLVQPFSQFNFSEIATHPDQPLNYFPESNYCWHCPLPCQSMGQQKLLKETFNLKTVLIDSTFANGFKMTYLADTLKQNKN